ncbi:hypothetical protein FCH28_29345 [Streptomyces piniterrae]|uniref:Uncharacterized protein n=1 Tax=Streptomyces piniterrae TaxID=2571125 RepID=A0A4U0MV89_9ACTN|nr:DUF6629 family protein [Streptomyces piniterrae]TJZ44656.1 hypothetical protein FCH28_29345 [Streptomyces piniterrae]
MCWSATADLAAGAGIAAVGVACLVRLRRVSDLPLAALPLLLGIHQIIESAVWRTGGGTGPATTAWAVVALPLLAVWVPLGVLLAAPPAARRRLLIPAAAGLATAAALAYGLADRPATAEIRGHTVGYLLALPYAPPLVAGYLAATVGALLLGGDPLLRLLGGLVGAGAVICASLWRLEFLSTWCAFAAVAALLMFGWVGRNRAAGWADAA